MRGIVVVVVVAVVAALGCGASPAPQVSSPTKVASTAKPPPRVPLPAVAYLASSRIAAIDSGALASDADSGFLVKTDRDGAPIARLEIGRDAGMLVYDPTSGTAYVADRRRDRVVAVDVKAMRAVREWKTPAEPFGVALTPDRATVLVSTIADRQLVAYDAATGKARWSVPIGPAARGIAVSPDGKRALVVVAGGVLDDVALDTHRVTPLELQLDCDLCTSGAAFGRASSVMFLDQYRAIASYQRAVPESLDMFVTERYGGASVPPVTQHLVFLSFDDKVTQVVAQVVANQPRSLLFDRGRDTVWIAGLSSDTLLKLKGLTRATTDEAEHRAATYMLTTRDRCGPDGIAQAADGSVYLWCSFARTVVRRPSEDAPDDDLREGVPVAASSMPADDHRGMVLFQSVNDGINRDHALACSTCHVDGLSDGLSWKIHNFALQTPSLAGRIPDTQPYKWDGSDATIRASIASTVNRLGGRGLGPDQTTALVAYLVTLPHPRLPTLDRAAVARGKAVFEGACATCHRGPRFTDNTTHKFESSLVYADTPSLVGLAASAPYFHDGSAPTLEALVRGDGNVHGMYDMTKLDAGQRSDLATFLATL